MSARQASVPRIERSYPNTARVRKQAMELRMLEQMPLNDLRELYGQSKLMTKRETVLRRSK